MMKKIIKNSIYFLFRKFLIRKGEPGSVYLTYDDGPHPENTEEILDVLSKYGAKATFFMIGSNMEKHPEIVEAVISQGHTIGYHSYNHKSLKKTSLSEIQQDFSHVHKLSERFNYPITLYRPPFGDISLVAFFWLLMNQWKIVMWSLDCMDSYENKEQVKSHLDPVKISDGEIILLHDDYLDAKEVIEAAMGLYNDQKIICRSL